MRPVRLAGVKGLLRVGGGGCSKGGRPCFSQRGVFFPLKRGLPPFEQPPPFKRTKGQGGLLRGGGGFFVEEGGGRVLLKKGGCWKREGKRIVENVDLGGRRCALPPNPPPAFFIFKVASSQGQTPSKNNMETNKKNTRRKTKKNFPPPPRTTNPLPPLTSPRPLYRGDLGKIELQWTAQGARFWS